MVEVKCLLCVKKKIIRDNNINGLGENLTERISNVLSEKSSNNTIIRKMSVKIFSALVKRISVVFFKYIQFIIKILQFSHFKFRWHC